MGVCSFTSRAVVMLLGLIFVAAAVALMFVGVSVYTTYNHPDQIATSEFLLIPASIVIAAGVFLFIVGIVACVAVIKENKCLLSVFFMILLVVFFAEVAAGITGYVYRTKVESSLKDSLQEAMANYSNPEPNPMRDQMDYIQHWLQCCGINNYTDWHTNRWSAANNYTVPTSCCIDDKHCDPIYHKGSKFPTYNHTIYEEGCFTKFDGLMKNNLGIIAGVAVAFAFIQVLGMIASCILLCGTKKGVPYENIQEPVSGLRV
ncbi:tetraspanin-3-like [Tubulanus polymorphus]|uniref:tetraspanin-3-like n=1 Tax=Tubulanus polymorphus TaxID=672921 RepID=UPI003DA46BA4